MLGLWIMRRGFFDGRLRLGGCGLGFELRVLGEITTIYDDFRMAQEG